MLFRLSVPSKMDFHRLFKRKEEVAIHPMSGEYQHETLGDRVVSLSEGDLFDGEAPAALLWNDVGGTIAVPVDEILGILEGRTRIKAAVLQQIYPALFRNDPHTGTEYFIPLAVVVTQLEDIFASISPGELYQEDFDTPFGQLAREDEANFREKPESVNLPPRPFALAGQNNGAKVSGRDRRSEPALADSPANPPSPPLAVGGAVEELRNASAGEPANREPAGVRGELPHQVPQLNSTVAREYATRLRPHSCSDVRREGQESLQELFLTDEQLDGSKVADLILQLPRVTGVVIMLSDGAVLGGGLSGGISESLLNLVPGFARDLARFTENLQGGPTRFVTFAGNAWLISVAIDVRVLILAGHDGKNLPPGLRERLVATAHALNMIYGPLP
jgi:hypothetical protein